MFFLQLSIILDRVFNLRTDIVAEFFLGGFKVGKIKSEFGKELQRGDPRPEITRGLLAVQERNFKRLPSYNCTYLATECRNRFENLTNRKL